MSNRNLTSARRFPSAVGTRARPRRVALLLLAALVGGIALTTVGCDKKTAADNSAKAPAAAPAGGAGSVAVINLDQVGRSVGWQGELEKSLQGTQDELKRQLDSYLRNDLQSAVEAKYRQVAAAARLTPAQADDLSKGKDWDKLNLTKEQREDLLRVSGNARQIVNDANQAANRIMQGRQLQLVNTYRDALRPIVRRVAQNNGVSVVLTHPVDQVFYFDPAVDLTDKVVDEVQKQNPARTFPDAPKLDLPRVDLTAAPTAAPTTAPASNSATRPAR